MRMTFGAINGAVVVSTIKETLHTPSVLLRAIEFGIRSWQDGIDPIHWPFPIPPNTDTLDPPFTMPFYSKLRLDGTPSGNSATMKYTEPHMRRPETANASTSRTKSQLPIRTPIQCRYSEYTHLFGIPLSVTWIHNIPSRSMASHVPSWTSSSSSPTCRGTPLALLYSTVPHFTSRRSSTLHPSPHHMMHFSHPLGLWLRCDWPISATAAIL